MIDIINYLKFKKNKKNNLIKKKKIIFLFT
jgi:hypothetical protein